MLCVEVNFLVRKKKVTKNVATIPGLNQASCKACQLEKSQIKHQGRETRPDRQTIRKKE
jgi:hypothetical protein